jgi:uncharacterized membrane protein
MTAHLLGNLMGRLVLSYALVWLLLCLTLARLSWRDACRRANHWSGLAASITTFLIGLAAAALEEANP